MKGEIYTCYLFWTLEHRQWAHIVRGDTEPSSMMEKRGGRHYEPASMQSMQHKILTRACDGPSASPKHEEGVDWITMKLSPATIVMIGNKGRLSWHQWITVAHQFGSTTQMN
jgi:hypothetical protein